MSRLKEDQGPKALAHTATQTTLKCPPPLVVSNHSVLPWITSCLLISLAVIFFKICNWRRKQRLLVKVKFLSRSGDEAETTTTATVTRHFRQKRWTFNKQQLYPSITVNFFSITTMHDYLRRAARHADEFSFLFLELDRGLYALNFRTICLQLQIKLSSFPWYSAGSCLALKNWASGKTGSGVWNNANSLR